jgi:hypothetical protein
MLESVQYLQGLLECREPLVHHSCQEAYHVHQGKTDPDAPIAAEQYKVQAQCQQRLGTAKMPAR